MAKWKVMHLGWGNPKNGCRLEGNWIKSSCNEKDVWLMRSSTPAVNVYLQHRNTDISSAASKSASLAGWGRWLSPTSLFSWDSTWSAVSSSGCIVLSIVELCTFKTAQRNITRIIRGLDNLSCEGKLRELGMVSLEKRKLQRDLPVTFQYL